MEVRLVHALHAIYDDKILRESHPKYCNVYNDISRGPASVASVNDQPNNRQVEVTGATAPLRLDQTSACILGESLKIGQDLIDV